MKLIGSVPSPYVRRVRVALRDQDYDFEIVDVFSPAGRAIVDKYTKIGRIPILIDEDRVVWDSFLIIGYLQQDKPFSIEVQKELVLINELTDAGVQLFLLRRNGTDTKDEGDFSQRNLKRISNLLDHYENSDLSEWNVVTQGIYCTLDWFSFRNVYPWHENHPNLVSFMEKNKDRDEIVKTDPRG